MFQGKKFAVVSLLFVVLLVVAAGAIAQQLGGLQAADTAIKNIKVGIYAAIGSFVGLWLLISVVLAKIGKMDWSDVVKHVIWVFIAGGSGALATWAWSLGAAQ